MNKKTSVIIYSIFTIILTLIVVMTISYQKILQVIGKSFNDLYGFESIDIAKAYGKIFLMACSVVLPLIVVVIGKLFTSSKIYLLIYIPLQIAMFILFYKITETSFQTLPISKDSEMDIILGFIPMFGKVKDFFNNLSRIYVWYTLPFILLLIKYKLINSIYLRNYEGNFTLRIILMEILMIIILILIPIAFAILYFMGGLFTGIIGTIVGIFILKIIFSFAPEYLGSATVSDQEGNTKYVDIYKK